MTENRNILEEKIFKIIWYMNNKNLEFVLKKNINFFWNWELIQLLDFLESWKIEILYKFIDNKYKEYLQIIQEIKQYKIKKEINKKIEIEKQEEEFELIEIELLLN
jgi:hypothetical protein